MVFDLIGPPVYVGCAWGLSAVTLLIAGLVMRNQLRIHGFLSWVLYLGLGPLGGIAALPIIDLFGVGKYVLPLLVVAMALSALFIRFLLPGIAPDFQTESFGATMMLGLLVALSVSTVGYTTREVPYIIPAGVLAEFEEFPSE
jgi:hypothetical protein